MFGIGIIGAGRIAKTHADACKSCEDVALIAVAEVNQDNLNKMTDEYQLRGYLNYEEMLAEEQLDGVIVCTPIMLHKEMVVRSLNRGVNVLCEKPLAATISDAEEMVTIAGDKNLLLMTGFSHRFFGPIKKAKELVEKGEIGEIREFRSSFRSAPLEKKPAWYKDEKLAGGGVLLDTAIHSIDLFRFLIGEIASLSCQVGLDEDDPETRLEHIGALLINSVEGTIGSIQTSCVTPVYRSALELYGEKGAIIVDYNASSQMLKLRHENDQEWHALEYDQTNRFVLQIKNFVAAVQGKERLLVSGEDGLKAVAVIQAAYQSFKNREILHLA